MIGMENFQRHPNTACSTCGKSIYRRPNQIASGSVYCSQDCRGKSQQKLHKCAIEDCPNMITSRKHKKTCSRACANKLKTGMKYKTGAPIKDKVKDLSIIRDRVIALRGNSCSRCGYNKYPVLHIHHIVERSKGGTDDINNLELICPTCHAEEHYLRRLAGVVDLASLERK